MSDADGPQAALRMMLPGGRQSLLWKKYVNGEEQGVSGAEVVTGRPL
jgi:hypothetical protein